jgi:hypothetical protein
LTSSNSVLFNPISNRRRTPIYADKTKTLIIRFPSPFIGGSSAVPSSLLINQKQQQMQPPIHADVRRQKHVHVPIGVHPRFQYSLS